MNRIPPKNIINPLFQSLILPTASNLNANTILLSQRSSLGFIVFPEVIIFDKVNREIFYEVLVGSLPP